MKSLFFLAELLNESSVYLIFCIKSTKAMAQNYTFLINYFLIFGKH